MGFNHCEPTWLGIARPIAAPRLTTREREVLRLIADGQSTRQIARDLAIASSTARTHASNVLVKLGARSRIQAVATASPPPQLPPPRSPILHPRVPESAPEPESEPDPDPEPEPDPLATLTRREREVLACMVEGLAQATMAERLNLSPHTVRTHARNILSKLDVHSTLEAAALARRLSCQTPDRPPAPQEALHRKAPTDQPSTEKRSTDQLSTNQPSIDASACPTTQAGPPGSAPQTTLAELSAHPCVYARTAPAGPHGAVLSTALSAAPVRPRRSA